MCAIGPSVLPSARYPGSRLFAMGRRILVSALLLLLPSVVLIGAWRLGGVSALEDDLLYYMPVRQHIGERVADGDLPMWNPLVGMGRSIAADPQAGLWYPPTHLFAILPWFLAYPLTIVLHFALAGAGMYRLLRTHRCEWRAALFGAIAFEFSGFLVAHRVHLTMLEAAAWIPWMLFGWRRFAETGRYRHFLVAVAALGAQLLVQHTQISIVTVLLISAYSMTALLAFRRTLLWQYPIGLGLGLSIGAIQLLPSVMHFLGSGRSSASYHLFVENSWWPSSSILLLFPMLFGSRTPNLWSDPWWGVSHFSEQSAYASVAVLIFAIGSLGLLWRRGGATSSIRREVIFWWTACLIALLLALGRFTPLSEWLFHVPIYNSLRCPARWTLVWSVAWPILAGLTASALLRRGEGVSGLGRLLRVVAGIVVPLIGVAFLGAVVWAYLKLDWLHSQFGGLYDAQRILSGLEEAVRLTNPAIWWPIALIAVTALLIVRWSHAPRQRRFAPVLLVCIIDLAAVAGFVDVDVSTYRLDDLLNPPPLAQAIQGRDPQPGQRLLLARARADYTRPVEILSPQTNTLFGVPTVNGYGPFQPVHQRHLFGFAPWGSSEAMLGLLRRPGLLQTMGVRFIAARSDEQRSLLEAASWPHASSEQGEPIPASWDPTIIQAGQDILWQVEVDEAGLYELSFRADAIVGNPYRWFVRLEDQDHEAVSRTRTFEPSDLASGRRRLHVMFVVSEPVEPLFVRLKAERGSPIRVRRATWRLAARVAAESISKPSLKLFGGPSELPGDIALYELAGSVPLVYSATSLETVAGPEAMVSRLLDPFAPIRPGLVIREGTAQAEGRPSTTKTEPLDVRYYSPNPDEVVVEVADASGGFIVLNMTYDPGWRAAIEGTPVGIDRVNGVSMGVEWKSSVPGRVQLTYRPIGIAYGAVLSLAGISGLLLTALAVGRWPANRSARKT